MLVCDIMTSPVVSVSPGTTLEQACLLMHEKGIRHLPVLDGPRLVGVVTDRDVHGATSVLCTTPANMQTRVGTIMSHPVHTAVPGDPVEEAASTMRGLKIGCLPVTEHNRVVGIITGIDLLDALLRLTGVTAPTARLEVKLSARPGELTRLTAAAGQGNLGIHSILTYPDESEGVRTVLRVSTSDTRQVATRLRDAGFEVLWPPARPWTV